MKCDGLLTFLLDTIGLLPFCALRYLVSARKPIMVSEDEEYDPSATLSLELGLTLLSSLVQTSTDEASVVIAHSQISRPFLR